MEYKYDLTVPHRPSTSGSRYFNIAASISITLKSINPSSQLLKLKLFGVLIFQFIIIFQVAARQPNVMNLIFFAFYFLVYTKWGFYWQQPGQSGGKGVCYLWPERVHCRAFPQTVQQGESYLPMKHSKEKNFLIFCIKTSTCVSLHCDDTRSHFFLPDSRTLLFFSCLFSLMSLCFVFSVNVLIFVKHFVVSICERYYINKVLLLLNMSISFLEHVELDVCIR